MWHSCWCIGELAKWHWSVALYTTVPLVTVTYFCIFWSHSTPPPLNDTYPYPYPFNVFFFCLCIPFRYHSLLFIHVFYSSLSSPDLSALLFAHLSLFSLFPPFFSRILPPFLHPINFFSLSFFPLPYPPLPSSNSLSFLPIPSIYSLYSSLPFCYLLLSPFPCPTSSPIQHPLSFPSSFFPCLLLLSSSFPNPPLSSSPLIPPPHSLTSKAQKGRKVPPGTVPRRGRHWRRGTRLAVWTTGIDGLCLRKWL